MITRRTVLRGAGAAIALPWVPSLAHAGSAPPPPLRTAFLYFPNGAVMGDWTFEATLAPLVPHRDELLLLHGLAHDKARANGDGPGDHARASATFLTGCQAKKTDGRNIRAGISADQVAAQAIGSRTALPSLELSCEAGAQSGNCDSGYSCAYSCHISWAGPQTPMTNEVNPRAVFERLFGDPDDVAADRERARRAATRRSILDHVREDAARVMRDASPEDRPKLAEYVDAVRAVERRIEAAEGDPVERPDIEIPRGIPRDFGEHLRLQMDLLVLAFQSDLTRIATLMYGNEGSNRPYPALGVKEGHHTISHHENRKPLIEQIRKIDAFHVEQFAYLLRRMHEAALLDHSMVVFGCAIADGNAHIHEDLPVVLAGRGGDSLTPGRTLRYPRNTPMANLYLSMLDRLGVEVERLGDSTGRLDRLAT